MSEKTYLYLLIFCVILCQEIIAKLSEENSSEFSDVLVRNRRVINHLPGGLSQTSIENVHYIVNIRESNRGNCVGAILSQHTVITSALCVRQPLEQYKILAGSAYNARFTSHNITSKILNYGNLPHQHYDGIALATVDPPFIFSEKIGIIRLFTGELAAGTPVTVTGWGHLYPPKPGPAGTRRGLRSITLPIINHGMCQQIYQEHYRHLGIHNSFAITDKHFCTYCEYQYCARNDIGAPLVLNGMLVGIHVFKGEFQPGTNPDVYINLQRVEYSAWIRQNTH